MIPARSASVVVGGLLLLWSCDRVKDPKWNNPLDPDGSAYTGRTLSPGDRVKFDVSSTDAVWTGEGAFLDLGFATARMNFSPHYIQADGANFVVNRVDGRFATTTVFPALYFPVSAAHRLEEAGTFVDPADGETYQTIRIGTQTWMAQNLRRATSSSTCYAGKADSCAKYGRLYSWTDAMGIGSGYLVRTWGSSTTRTTGICPVGWHIPSDAEWRTLWNTVPAGEGNSLKTYNGWGNDDGGTDTAFFHALPSGLRFPGGTYDSAGTAAFFWSSGESNDSTAIAWAVRRNNSEFKSQSNYYKSDGYSVRCLRN